MTIRVLLLLITGSGSVSVRRPANGERGAILTLQESLGLHDPCNWKQISGIGAWLVSRGLVVQVSSSRACWGLGLGISFNSADRNQPKLRQTPESVDEITVRSSVPNVAAGSAAEVWLSRGRLPESGSSSPLG